MEQLTIRVPYSFIRKWTDLGWTEISYGLAQGILGAQDAIDVAQDRLAGAVAAGPELAALAEARTLDPVQALVEQLARHEPEASLSELQRKWMFLLLAWVFEHRSDYADPLGIVELLYADLDYPAQVESLVRYMPMEEPDLGSTALNEARLMTKWAEYLKAERLLYAQRAAGAG